MNTPRMTRDETFGLVHPAVDAHTLGISALAQLLRDCGCRVCTGDHDLCTAMGQPEAFIQKPYPLLKLAQTIESVLAGRAGAARP